MHLHPLCPVSIPYQGHTQGYGLKWQYWPSELRESQNSKQSNAEVEMKENHPDTLSNVQVAINLLTGTHNRLEMSPEMSGAIGESVKDLKEAIDHAKQRNH